MLDHSSSYESYPSEDFQHTHSVESGLGNTQFSMEGIQEHGCGFDDDDDHNPTDDDDNSNSAGDDLEDEHATYEDGHDCLHESDDHDTASETHLMPTARIPRKPNPYTDDDFYGSTGFVSIVRWM